MKMPEDVIDLGAAVFSRGLFLVRPQEERLADVWSGAGGDGFVCTTSHGGGSNLKEELLSMIRSARRKIFVASFRFGDPDIINELEKAAGRLRGGVYVITALDESSLRRGLEELGDDESDVLLPQKAAMAAADEVLKKQFSTMTRKGIYCRGHSGCHAKFAVVDDERALVASANFEPRAFGTTGECGVVLSGDRQVGEISRLFARLWHEGCDWEIAPGDAYIVRRRTPVPAPCRVPIPGAAGRGDGSHAIWTDGSRETHILRTIHEVINAAEEDLILASFSLCDLEKHPALLFDPLRKARERRPDLRVRMYVRGRNHFATHRAAAEILHDMGVEIFADSLNHAKGAIADGGALAALFSANFDARHGLLSGVEAGVRLAGHAAGRSAAAWFEHSMGCSDLVFRRGPSAEEVSRNLAAGWKCEWPWRKQLEISTDGDHLWESLRDGAGDPILYEFRGATKEEGIHLYAKRRRFLLYRDAGSGGWRCRTSGSQPEQDAAERFESWLSRRDESMTRGIARGLLKRVP